jgi:hypothetical protein
MKLPKITQFKFIFYGFNFEPIVKSNKKMGFNRINKTIKSLLLLHSSY